tara:strand:- start:2085 stop:3038 length:954 start_codon:yes stop_codon:yes gene_type:complete
MYLNKEKSVILIGGPTCSGKSAVARKLAEKLEPHAGALIINCDSMQVYKSFRILTSRPTVDDEYMYPHRLYGFYSSSDVCSVSVWRDYAIAAIKFAWKKNMLPIVVGGTGLYFKALQEGIAEIPAIDNKYRLESKMILDSFGVSKLYEDLKKIDPFAAGKIMKNDKQRIARAWVIFKTTGQSIFHWQSGFHKTFKAKWLAYWLSPERSFLYKKIDDRFVEMINSGAIEEVKNFKNKNFKSNFIVSKAVGFQELSAYLDGKINLTEAKKSGQQATRRLAKRQYTWFNNQMSGWTKCSGTVEQNVNIIFTNLCNFVLTE